MGTGRSIIHLKSLYITQSYTQVYINIHVYFLPYPMCYPDMQIVKVLFEILLLKISAPSIFKFGGTFDLCTICISYSQVIYPIFSNHLHQEPVLLLIIA